MRRTNTFLALLICLVGIQLADAQNPHGGGGPQSAKKSVPMRAQELAKGVVEVSVLGPSNLEGITVALIGDAQKRQVLKTNAKGNVVFRNIATGERYRISSAAGAKVLESEVFVVPRDTGIRVSFTTLQQGARAKRPDPRNMSGMPRPDQNDPGGSLVIRPIQGALKDSEFAGVVSEYPVGSTIHLVALDTDGEYSMESKVVAEDNQGRVVFDGLDRSGSKVYYALSLFNRADATDRLASQPVVMPPEVGVRLMLAGPDKNAAVPAVDDFEIQEGQSNAPAPKGEARVRLLVGKGVQELAQEISTIELIDVSSKKVIATQQVSSKTFDAADVVAESIQIPANTIKSLAPGQVGFMAVRPSTNQTLDAVKISIRIEGAEENSFEITTNQDGMALAPEAIKPDTKYVAETTYKGKKVSTEAFELNSSEPQAWAFVFEWPDDSIREARFGGLSSDDSSVYIARAKTSGRTFLTRPFQMSASFGSNVSMFVYPQLLVRLHGGAEFDDGRQWFNVQFSLINPAVHPIKLSKKGILIPLPKHFVNASVQEEFSSRVKVEPGKGFRWRGGFPPGQEQFIGQFALLSDDGATSIDMPLPFGLMDGGIMIQSFPGMKVSEPSMGQLAPNSRQGRKTWDISSLSANPGASLRFDVSGLPQHPKWKEHVKLGLGAIVMLLLGWAIFGMARQANSSQTLKQRALDQERGRLLDALARIESDFESSLLKESVYKNKRKELMSKLENLYVELNTSKGRTI